jgi:hypothetical protein
MSEEQSRKFHPMAWLLSILSAIVIYVLSAGPVVGLEFNGVVPSHNGEWQETFYAPVLWLLEYTPLHDPLDAYFAWWMKVLKKH